MISVSYIDLFSSYLGLAESLHASVKVYILGLNLVSGGLQCTKKIALSCFLVFVFICDAERLSQWFKNKIAKF